MAVLTAGTFLGTVDETGTTFTKLADITTAPFPIADPTTVDVTTLSDWAHKEIVGLYGASGVMNFAAFLDGSTLPNIDKTVHYKKLCIWYGGQKDGDTIKPTGSILKVSFEADVTYKMNDAAVDAAHAVTIGVVRNSLPEIVYGKINTEATTGATTASSGS